MNKLLTGALTLCILLAACSSEMKLGDGDDAGGAGSGGAQAPDATPANDAGELDPEAGSATDGGEWVPDAMEANDG